MSIRYSRALCPEVATALSAGSMLRFLISGVHELSDDPCALDIQVRENNVLMYYHGTTRLLTLTFLMGNRTEISAIRASASKAYGEYPQSRSQYHRLMKEWPLHSIEEFEKAWRTYIRAALQGANSRYYSNKQEGYWQNRICIEFGLRWTPDREWLVIDRECVLGFKSDDDKKNHYQATQRTAELIIGGLKMGDPKRWGKPSEKGFGDEADLLAIDKTGRLSVIELKHGSNTSGIYWGPLQVGIYHDAFKKALPEVAEGIMHLVNQKISLGMLPIEARSRLGNACFALADPILAIAEPNNKSGCWNNLREVRNKMGNIADAPLKIAMLRMNSDAIELRTCDPDNAPDG